MIHHSGYQRELTTSLDHGTANPEIWVPTTEEDLNHLNSQLASEMEKIGEVLNVRNSNIRNQALFNAQKHAVPVGKYVPSYVHLLIIYIYFFK